MIFQFGGKKAQLDIVQTVVSPKGGNNACFSFSPPCNSKGDTGRTQLSAPLGPGLINQHMLVSYVLPVASLANLFSTLCPAEPPADISPGGPNPAKTRRCAFACGGGGGHTPDLMPGRERERERGLGLLLHIAGESCLTVELFVRGEHHFVPMQMQGYGCAGHDRKDGHWEGGQVKA